MSESEQSSLRKLENAKMLISVYVMNYLALCCCQTHCLSGKGENCFVTARCDTAQVSLRVNLSCRSCPSRHFNEICMNQKLLHRIDLSHNGRICESECHVIHQCNLCKQLEVNEVTFYIIGTHEIFL